MVQVVLAYMHSLTTRWTRRAGLVTSRVMRTGRVNPRPAGQRERYADNSGRKHGAPQDRP